MASDVTAMVKEQAPAFLEPGEQVLAAMIAQARGTNVAQTPGLATSAIGQKWAGKSKGDAQAAGLELSGRLALAVSDRRLLVFGVNVTAMGKPKELTGLTSSAPLGDVDSITLKRLLRGRTVTVAMGGSQFKLEAPSGADAAAVAAAFEQAKPAA